MWAAEGVGSWGFGAGVVIGAGGLVVDGAWSAECWC